MVGTVSCESAAPADGKGGLHRSSPSREVTTPSNSGKWNVVVVATVIVECVVFAVATFWEQFVDATGYRKIMKQVRSLLSLAVVELGCANTQDAYPGVQREARLLMPRAVRFYNRRTNLRSGMGYACRVPPTMFCEEC